MTSNKSQIIDIPKLSDPRGNISIIEELKDIPFNIQRAYWIYDVPGGCNRGEHALKTAQEFIVALSGSFDVILDNGHSRQVHQLNRSYKGVYVPAGTWRRMTNFSTNSLALVLSSTDYDANDYIMDYDEFRQWTINPSFITNSPNIKDVEQNNPQPYHFSAYGSNVNDCTLCELTKMHHDEGNLTFVYPHIHIPFDIKRVFYSYDIPAGVNRGAHAHKDCHQFIIAASGAFEVLLDDGCNKKVVTLNRPFRGLHIPPGIWASEQEFSSGSICLVLCSHQYNEDDYIRSYTDYVDYKNT